MTAIAAKQGTGAAVRFSPLQLIGIVLGVLLIGAYVFLPFANQPELGATTVPVLTAERGNNEIGITTNGLVVLPMVGLAVVLLGIWNILSRQAGRTISLLVAAAGAVGLTYYVIFFLDYFEEEATFLGDMGISFWAMLAVCVIMIAQIVIPRGEVSEQFKIRNMLGNQESILVFILLALVIVVGINNPRFLAERNVSDILQGNAYIAVAAVGMSMVIVTGNIDISIGSGIALLAVISGRLVVDTDLPIIVTWLAPIVLGGIIYGGIGFIIAYLRIPSIVVTLGMLSILKGVLILWTAGERVTDMPEGYFLAQMRPLGIPMPIIFMIVAMIFGAWFMRYTAFGRSLYAVGGNKEAARLSGINEKQVVLIVFVIHGIFGGIAALIYATQLTIIQVTPPAFLELVIITAAVVGGVSILGGTGTVIGSTIAAILLNTIRSALVFVNVSPFWLQAVQGIMILLTVLADLFRRRRQQL